MVIFDGPAPTIEQGDGYEIWRVQGETIANLSDGETLENVLIDQRGSGETLNIAAVRNSGFTIRNIGWKGVGYNINTSGWGTKFHLTVSGTGSVENIFIDDRAPVGQTGDTHIGGGFTPQHHGGQIDVRNSFIAGTGNNAFYASNPGKDGGGDGATTFEDCYHRDNVVSQYRIGTPGSYVRNCVGVLNDPDGRRGYYPGHNTTEYKNARIVWGRHYPDQIAEDSAFHQDPNDIRPDAAFMSWYRSDRSNGPYNELIVRDSDINSSVSQTRNGIQSERAGGTVTLQNITNNPAEDVLIDGVPTTPEMAARGERHIPDIPELSGSGGGGDPGCNGDDSNCPDGQVCKNDQCVDDPTLTDFAITNDGSSRTDYEVTVDGTVVSTSGFGTGDSVDRSGDYPVVSGFVNGGTDAFVYDGCIRAATITGPSSTTITLDGAVVSRDGLVECPPDPCFGVECPPDQVCLNGTCVDCKTTEDCPDGFVCENNQCVEVTVPPEPEPGPTLGDAIIGLGVGVGAGVLRKWLRNQK